MNKLGIIIKQEVKNRVFTKRFVLITLLAPLSYLLIFAFPILANTFNDKETKNILVVDETGALAQSLKSDNVSRFIPTTLGKQQAEDALNKSDTINYILYIPKTVNGFNTGGIQIVGKKIIEESAQRKIEKALNEQLKIVKADSLKVNLAQLEQLKVDVKVSAIKMTEKGRDNVSAAASTAVAFISALLIYIFIMGYGGSVMQAVQQEKQNRVAEVMVSIVKPFDLLMGKIIGVAIVGLLQFSLWIILSIVLTRIVLTLIGAPEAMALGGGADAMGMQPGAEHMSGSVSQISEVVGSLPLFTLLLAFLFYFITGYLTFSALFAMLAASTDTDSDRGQIMLPVMIPIILTLSSLPTIIDNPDGTFSVWLSMIPFTAPIAMMARIPFGVPAWQLILSGALMIIGFVGVTAAAARIYRIGLLMYGNKFSLKNTVKWLKMK